MFHSDLSIISIIYSEKTAQQLEINRKLTSRLNPNLQYYWLVGFNFTKANLGPSDVIREKFSKEIRCYDNEHVYFKSRRATGALQHSLALNKVLREVNSRFLLVLDPDFFCIRPNWIPKIIEHIKSSQTAIIGSTWHPKNYKKYRYFPSIHFMLIDLHQVGKEVLDFRGVMGRQKSDEERPNSITSLFAEKVFKRHTNINVNVDPGTKIYHRYRNSDLVTETFKPSYSPYRSGSIVSRLGYVYTLLTDFLFSKDKRILPDKNYYTQKRFCDYGFDNLYGKNWEEFFWLDEPFGFHVRNTLTSESVSHRESLNTTSDELKSILSTISQVVEYATTRMEQRNKNSTSRDKALSSVQPTDGS